MSKYKDIVERLVYYSKGGKPLSMNHPIVEDAINTLNTSHNTTYQAPAKKPAPKSTKKCILLHCDEDSNGGDYCERHLNSGAGYFG